MAEWRGVMASRTVRLLAGAALLGAVAVGAYLYGSRGGMDVTVENNSAAQAQPAPLQPDPSDPQQIGKMELQAQFVGPLKDTVIQRWRDPHTGAVCYIYLPIVVQHSQVTPTGFVQYGPNGIGTISCLPR